MEIQTEDEAFLEKMYNGYRCRFCDYDANSDLELLQNHFTEKHPVTSSMNGGNIEFYQAGGMIALRSKTHKYCCFENCPNNQTLVLKRQCYKLSVQLKYGGHYPQLEPFFDEYHYNQEPHVFACSDLLEQSRIYGADMLLRWISQFGLMRTFSLKNVVKRKNKNLLLIKRVPKIKDQVAEEIKSLLTEKIDLKKEKKESDMAAKRCQVVSVNLSKTVARQANIIYSDTQNLNEQMTQTKDQMTQMKDQMTQMADFIGVLGYHVFFGLNNKMVVMKTNETDEVSPNKKIKLG